MSARSQHYQEKNCTFQLKILAFLYIFIPNILISNDDNEKIKNNPLHGTNKKKIKKTFKLITCGSQLFTFLLIPFPKNHFHSRLK